jgi:epoxide hydrolase-like predicted phosphatase
MSIKAIIWDFAGVLLHTVKGDFNSLLAERLGVPIEEIVRVFSTEENSQWDLGEIDDHDFFTFVLKELQLPEEKRAVLDRFVLKDFYVQAELLEYIRGIRQTYMTVLLTNFPTHLHDFLKTDWHIENTFDHLIASCDIKLIKPDERIYRYTLEKIGCRAEETIFIDDREVNIKGAQAVGIPSLLYRSTPQIMADIQKKLVSN